MVCAVAAAILYVMGPTELGRRGLAWTAAGCVFVAVIAFLVCTYINVNYAYNYSGRAATAKKDKRLLGGYDLTAEAKKIREKEEGMEHATPQQLFKFANYDPDLVWTRQSRAVIHVVSITSYLILQAFGSIGLASAAILLGLASASARGGS